MLVLKNALQFNSPFYLVSGKKLPSNEIILRLDAKSRSTRVDQDKDKRYNSAMRYVPLHGCNQSQEGLKKGIVGYGKAVMGRKFTATVKNNCRRIASALDREYDKKNLLFCTFTLPGSTAKALESISAYSSYIVDRFNRFFSIKFGGCPFARINVWEYQKRGALHLHLLIGSENIEAIDDIKKSFKSFCIRLLDDVGNKFGCDVWQKDDKFSHKKNKSILRCESKEVRKSVARYLSKYMSKGSGNHYYKKFFSPVRYCTYNRYAKALFHKHCESLSPRRIGKKTAIELIESIIENARFICHSGYSTPLVYMDKFGSSINVRIILNPDSFVLSGESIEDVVVAWVQSIIDRDERYDIAQRFTRYYCSKEELEVYWLSQLGLLLYQDKMRIASECRISVPESLCTVSTSVQQLTLDI